MRPPVGWRLTLEKPELTLVEAQFAAAALAALPRHEDTAMQVLIARSH